MYPLHIIFNRIVNAYVNADHLQKSKPTDDRTHFYKLAYLG